MSYELRKAGTRLDALPRAGRNVRSSRADHVRAAAGGGGAGKKCRRASNRGASRRLVIMVKAPVAGRVKTRLAREAGVVAATSFYRHATTVLVSRLSWDRRWETLLAVAPDVSASARFWPAGVSRMRQGAGDLGQRMQRLFDRLPAGPVVIIGSDCVGVRAADIAEAFRQLGEADAVIGPATDGGYWLIGERRLPKPLQAFRAVRWSSATTMEDTLGNFKGRRVSKLRELSDVDTARDLDAIAARGRRIGQCN